MKKFWAPYLSNMGSFEFIFNIPLNTENVKDIILEMDCFFLLNADKYKILYFKDIDVNKYVLDYTNERKKQFLNPDNYPVAKFLLLAMYYDNTKDELDNMYYGIPEYINSGIEIVDTPYIPLSNIIETGNSFGFLYNDGTNTFRRTDMLGFCLMSKSNIWWEEIGYEISSNGRKAGYELDTPHNNRDIAYRITPRFNSLIRALSEKTISLGGTVDVDNESYRNSVTKEGILLDGKIIYQEDIDNGLIELPPPRREDE